MRASLHLSLARCLDEFATRSRRFSSCVPACHSPSSGTGLLTCFPSATLFRFTLGPAYPGRTNLPQVPLGFRGDGFSPSSRYSCLHPLLCLVHGSSRRRFSLSHIAPLPISQFRSFGGRLEPPVSSAQRVSTGELLRTLLRMAASKPTSQLSSTLHFLLHLAVSLGP